MSAARALVVLVALSLATTARSGRAARHIKPKVATTVRRGHEERHIKPKDGVGSVVANAKRQNVQDAMFTFHCTDSTSPSRMQTDLYCVRYQLQRKLRRLKGKVERLEGERVLEQMRLLLVSQRGFADRRLDYLASLETAEKVPHLTRPDPPRS
jgi:TolA-binding protein